MGGTNDPSNLIEITIEQHAEAHKALYEQHGKEEDRIAWLALSGQISKKEALILSRRLGRKITNAKLKEKYGEDWRSILANLGSAKGIEALRKYKLGVFDPATQAKGQHAALSKSSRAKRKDTFEKIGHQQGEKNSNFGKHWVHNDTLRQTKLVIKTSPLMDGWAKGRKNYSQQGKQ